MDYFSVKQNYYTGNFVQCLQEIEKFNKVTDNTLLFYKAKTLLALSQYQPQDPTSKLGKALDLYVQFLDTKDITELEGLLKDKQSSPYELHLLASAQAVSYTHLDVYKRQGQDYSLKIVLPLYIYA